jgi:hypothetical protein
MNVAKIVIRHFVALAIGCVCSLPLVPANAAVSNGSVPPAIEAGLEVFAKGMAQGGGAAAALEVWQRGGLLEGDRKIAVLASYFRRIEQAVGNYKFHELIETKRIGPSSQVIYLSLNFERAAVYARFLLYRTEKYWVIQDMDFSTRPESIMPWLPFQATNYAE